MINIAPQQRTRTDGTDEHQASSERDRYCLREERASKLIPCIIGSAAFENETAWKGEMDVEGKMDVEDWGKIVRLKANRIEKERK